VAKSILEDNYNKLIERITMKSTPRSRQIMEILLHSVSVLLQREDVPLLKPFVELLKSPGSFEVSSVCFITTTVKQWYVNGL